MKRTILVGKKRWELTLFEGAEVDLLDERCVAFEFHALMFVRIDDPYR